MKKPTWFLNLSLKTKLLIMFALVGLVPLAITFLESYGEIRNASLQSQNYAANQNYEQTHSILSSKMARIEKMSSMVIVNEALSAALIADPETTDIGEQILNFDEVVSYTQVLEASSEVDNIVYYIDDRFVVTGADTRFRMLSRIEPLEWAHKLNANGGAPTWLLYEDDSSPPAKSYLTLGRIMWNMEDYQEPIGTVVINLDLKQISQSLTKSVPEQFVYLATEEGEMIASSDNSQLGTMRLPQTLETGNRFLKVTQANDSYQVRSNQIGHTGIYLVSVIPQSAAAAAMNKVGTQIITVYLLVSVALLLLIFPITKSVTHRVMLLTKKMDQVRKGWLQSLDIAPRDDEVGRLVSSYNYMIDNVQNLLQEQFKLGQEKKGAELKALQSQINPHFLYNTLDMLFWMAQKGEKENIQQVIYALSDYYKLILNKGEDLVTVGDEIRLSSIYIDIQQKRFKGRIQFEIDVEKEVEECLIPKITLQPLVENAIVHGISENPEGKGTIIIRGTILNQRMILSVVDDGIGMEEEKSERPGYHGSGYGVNNIEKRLNLYFGEQTCMRFESAPGAGTSVIIDVPVIKSLEAS
ncbi:sensor histidine kinase [Cohnella sp.]|uniref:cache domain-containing sensor histidine kinase n=1 Tax=Cohnella sp. TaxID=1883426 RepID=UPI003564DC06